MTNLFDGKVAIVTGAGGKLGRAIAVGLAVGGAKVLIVDIRDGLLEETASEIKAAGGDVEKLATDISAKANCVSLVEAAVAHFGRLDIVVNNAGIIAIAPLDQISEQDWTRIFAVNVHAPIFIIQAALPHLLKNHGNVVNVASNSAFRGQAYMPAYGASKAALVNATMSLTMEFIHEPVRFNSVAPGAINTNMANNTPFPEGGKGINPDLIARVSPLRPYSEPEEIAEVVLFLASEKASAVRGACFTVDQGMLAG